MLLTFLTVPLDQLSHNVRDWPSPNFQGWDDQSVLFAIA